MNELTNRPAVLDDIRDVFCYQCLSIGHAVLLPMAPLVKDMSLIMNQHEDAHIYGYSRNVGVGVGGGGSRSRSRSKCRSRSRRRSRSRIGHIPLPTAVAIMVEVLGLGHAPLP